MPPRPKLAPEITTFDAEIIYPPGYSPTDPPPLRRRRRRRRPLWRRPIFIVPVVLLVLLVSGAGAVVYRTNGVMSNLRTISTPPPMITDATFMEEDDPDMPAGPITVDTGPAQSAIREVADERSLPKPQDTGFGARIGNITSGVGDLANAASVAGGIGGPKEEGFTMLVMGVDAQPGAAIDIGVRPDVMMLIRFDPNTHSCRMLSIPRDTRVELPGYGQTKINHALMVGGIPYQLLVTEDFIEHPIDHYVLLDFQAFEQAVDVVGGINVDVERDMEKSGIVLSAGPQELNGEEALAYARFRTPEDDGDISRVKRQWSILGGLADAAQGRDLISDVNTLVPTVEEHIRTDLTLTEMTTLARDYGDQCLNIDRDSIAMTKGTRVQFNDPILNQRLYYNVVQESTVQQRIEEFLSGTQAVPDPDVQATPSPEVEATPAARWSPGQSRYVGARVGRT
jgi:LCP family protein required for cell wall assembly